MVTQSIFSRFKYLIIDNSLKSFFAANLLKPTNNHEIGNLGFFPERDPRFLFLQCQHAAFEQLLVFSLIELLAPDSYTSVDFHYTMQTKRKGESRGNSEILKNKVDFNSYICVHIPFSNWCQLHQLESPILRELDEDSTMILLSTLLLTGIRRLSASNFIVVERNGKTISVSHKIESSI